MKKLRTLVVVNCLQEAREKKGYSQEKLADLSGTTVNTINAIEKGIYNPSLLLSLTICKVIDCDIDTVFGLSVKEIEESETLLDIFKNINRNLKNEKGKS